MGTVILRYNIDNMLAISMLKSLKEAGVFEVYENAVIDVLNVFATTNFDFVDSLLIAYHKIDGNQILTFNKAMIKYMQNT